MSATTPATTTETTPLLADGSDDSSMQGKNLIDPMTLSSSRRRAILAGVWLAAFLSALNSTMVATRELRVVRLLSPPLRAHRGPWAVVSTISSQFQRSHQASWLGTSFLLATSTFTPLYGRLSNALGRRGANQTAIAFCALGTLASGLAPTMETLVLGRFLAGAGGGGIFTTMSIITADMYSLRDRSMTQGIANVFTGLGMGLGGPFGGFIADRFGWRLAFLVQMPFFILAFFLSWTINYTTPGRSKSKIDVFKKVDWTGTGMLLCFTLSLLCFLSFKFQSDFPWDDARVVASIAIVILASVSFFYVELYVAPAPVLAPFLLAQRIPVLVGMSNFLVAFCNFSMIFFVPILFETVFLTSAGEAGLHLLPNSLAMSLGSLFAGYYLQRVGKYKMLNIVFGIFPTVAAILVAKLRQDSGQLAQWLSITTLGFGNAVVLQTTLVALLASVGNSHNAVAIGFGQLWRGIGQVSGVAVSSAVFQTILAHQLKQRLTFPGAENLIIRIRQSSKLVVSLPPDIRKEAQASYAAALHVVFMLAAISTFSAFLVRLPIPEQSLDEAKTPTPGPSVAATPSESRAATPARGDSSQDIQAGIRSKLHKASTFGYGTRPRASVKRPRRRLSTYERGDGADPEEDENFAQVRAEHAQARAAAASTSRV
ncbi:vacuolar amino acid permease [Auriculariales sp. MPI-PUGE-AT-0066]|nr:vacuolar amino acid permease [Auriculariales sp. MPI-PUGE-AT-0066]